MGPVNSTSHLTRIKFPGNIKAAKQEDKCNNVICLTREHLGKQPKSQNNDFNIFDKSKGSIMRRLQLMALFSC